MKSPNVNFHENPSYNSHCFGIRMARWTQMTKANVFLPIVFELAERFSNTHLFIYFNFLIAAYHNEVLMWYTIGQYHNLEVKLRNKLNVLKRKIYVLFPTLNSFFEDILSSH